MRLKMKNVNIMEVHRYLGDGGTTRNNIYGELAKKGRLGQFAIGLAKNRERADTAMHTMT